MAKRKCDRCDNSGVIVVIGEDQYPGNAHYVTWLHNNYPTQESQEAAQISIHYCSCEVGNAEAEAALNVHTPRPILFESVVLLKVALNNVESIGVFPSEELRLEVEQMKQSLKLLHRKFSMEWERQ